MWQPSNVWCDVCLFVLFYPLLFSRMRFFLEFCFHLALLISSELSMLPTPFFRIHHFGAGIKIHRCFRRSFVVVVVVVDVALVYRNRSTEHTDTFSDWMRVRNEQRGHNKWERKLGSHTQANHFRTHNSGGIMNSLWMKWFLERQ